MPERPGHIKRIRNADKKRDKAGAESADERGKSCFHESMHETEQQRDYGSNP